jgi:hypothetical protein
MFKLIPLLMLLQGILGKQIYVALKTGGILFEADATLTENT